MKVCCKWVKLNSHTHTFFISPFLSLAVRQTDTTYRRNPIPSVSSPPPANQMHSENKLTNHGKQVTSGAQSQLPNVNQAQQQGPASTQGSKSSASGNHGVKSNQISPGNPGLKSLSQSSAGVGVGGIMKTKAKRERSVSMDTGDQRESITPVLEPDVKGRYNTCVRLKKHAVTPLTDHLWRIPCIKGMMFFKSSNLIGSESPQGADLVRQGRELLFLLYFMNILCERCLKCHEKKANCVP